MKKDRFANLQWTPSRIVFIYILLGCLWILLSDKLLIEFVSDQNTLNLLQMYKGWFYIFLTGSLLYALIQSGIKRTREIEAAKIAYIKRYDDLVENARDCIFTLDINGNFTAINLAVEKITGYSREELLKLNIADILAPENRDYVIQLLDPQNTQNPNFMNEVKIIGKDGRISFLEINSRPLSLYDRRVSIENIARDVTQRRLMEAELHETELRYKNLIETANEGIWTVGPDFRITLINPKMCELIGYSADEVLGKSMLDLFDHDLKKQTEEKLLMHREGTRKPLDFQFNRPDGRQIWLLISSNPIICGSEFQGILYMATDITARKRAEEQIRESKERFRILFERSAVGTMILTTQGQVIDCNAVGAEMLGYTQEEVKNLTVFDFEALHTREEILEINAKVAEKKRRVQFETLHRTKSGEIKNVLVVASRIQIEGQEFGFASFIDITDKKRSEAKLRESEERFRVLFERSAVGKIIVSKDLQILDCNRIAAEMLGYTQEELKQIKIFDLDVGLSEEEILEFQRRIYEEKERIQLETRHRTKSGEIKEVLVVASALTIGEEACAFASFLDITDKKRAEEELRREKERLEKIATVSPSVIHTFRFTEENKPYYPFSSPAIYSIYGKTPEELANPKQNVEGLTHPDDVPYLIESLKKSAETLTPSHDIWRVNNPQKGEIWVEGYVAPVLETDGSVTWYGIMNDVTERVHKEKALAERERMLTAINNATPSVIMLWNLNTSKTIYINESVLKVLGYTPEERYALSREEMFSSFHPEDLSATMDFIKRLAGAADGEVLTYEFRYQTKSGKMRLMRSQNVVFERDRDGNAITALSVVDDITESKFAVEALQKSEERLQKLYRIISNSDLDHKERIKQLLELGTIEFGVENAFLGYVNDEKYCISETISPDQAFSSGFTCDLKDTFCQEVLRQNDLLAIENAGASSWRDQSVYGVFGMEVYIGIPIKHSGKDYGTLCFTGKTPRTSPFPRGDFEFLKLMAQWVSAELTRQTAEEALRKSEEQLLQSQKLESVGRLAGGIAHDFNNMLTAINGYSDLILRRLEETNPLRSSIEEIKRAGERSAALTQQLLAFSRKQLLKPEIVNINQIVSDTSTLLERLIGENISLIKILDSTVESVEIDPGQLSQMIVNLSINARDAMPRGGTLTIETKSFYLDEKFARMNLGSKTGKFVMLSVRDTGIGMSEETMQQIFEPFFTTKDIGKGTGLGLATVYGFIKQSGGYITVESQIGKGTIFKIYLPCVKEISVKEKEEFSKEKSKQGAETILLVEDEDIVRKLSREILQSLGYQVIEAVNGVDALEICEKNNLQIDLLLTDVVMPQMNGSELWGKLTKIYPRMKVLFTSGYTDDMIVRSGLKNDETNFLQKPFSSDTLLQKVRDVLDEDYSNN